jgi:hypothetical protein
MLQKECGLKEGLYDIITNQIEEIQAAVVLH